MAKALAEVGVCAGIINEGIQGHAMRDGCWNCAPYWEIFPICPTDRRMLNSSGYCKGCRKYYDLAPYNNYDNAAFREKYGRRQ